jgi:O-antigen/teichoic acid export membrane protein
VIRALDRATAFRVGRTLSAQAYGQIVTVAVQLALVPLLLHAWGTGIYGSWLLLSAVPFYLTFSDFGFTFVAKNAMVMAVAGGRREEAVRVFHSVFALLCVAVPLLMAGSAALVFALDLPTLLGLDTVPAAAVRATLLLLALNVLLYQFFLLVCAGIRSENRPASEAMWAATARLGEGVAVATAALAGGGIVAAAAMMVAARLLFLIGGYRWLRARTAWLRLGWAHAERATLGRLWRPALAYTALPIGQALLIQGPVLVVGSVLGPAATVVFATSRTVARLGTAAIGMINNSVISEFAALAGAGDRRSAARLFRAQAGVTLLMTAGYMLAVTALAPMVLSLLTQGTVTVVQPFFLLLVCGVTAEMLWSALFTPVAAVNRHRGVTLAFAVLAVAAFGAAYPLAAWFGLAGIAAALLATHAAMIPLCLWAWRRREG